MLTPTPEELITLRKLYPLSRPPKKESSWGVYLCLILFIPMILITIWHERMSIFAFIVVIVIPNLLWRVLLKLGADRHARSHHYNSDY